MPAPIQAPKPIISSRHALGAMIDRGATCEEAEEAIRQGEQIPVKKGRIAFRKNFPHQAPWEGRYYENKQVMPVVAEEADCLVVVTVYTFFFGGEG